MIEMHTHILPGIDNGCNDYNDAEKIIDEAIELDITEIVLTPHNKTDKKNIITRYNTFVKWFKKKGIKFHLGCEIDYSMDVLEQVKNKELLTMIGTNVVLIDYLDSSFEEILDSIKEFKKIEYRVIIAHIERYQQLTINNIEDLKNIGALIQVDAETICDKKNEKWVKQMLKERLIDFVSSNIHNSQEKNFMNNAFSIIKKKTNSDYAELIFKRNHKNLIFL